MKQGWHIGVVIPARNEEAHIREVLEGLPEMVDVAVVVNDGSTDRTAEIVNTAAANCELLLLEGRGDGQDGARRNGTCCNGCFSV